MIAEILDWRALGSFGGNTNSSRRLARALDATLWSAFDDGHATILSKSTDNGETWESENVIGSTYYPAMAPSIAIDSVGQVHLLVHDYDHHTLSYLTGTLGAWSAPFMVATSAASGVIAIDSEDVIHVIYEKWPHVGIYHREKNGGWHVAECIADEGGTFPSVAVDTSDILHVVWPQPYLDRAIRYSSNAGGGWSAPETISVTPSTQISPRIIAGVDNSIHVTWAGKGIGSPEPMEVTNPYYYYNIQYRRRAPGGEWQEQVSMSEKADGNRQHAPSISIASDGAIYIVWWGTDWGCKYNREQIQMARYISDSWLMDMPFFSFDSSFTRCRIPNLLYSLYPVSAGNRPGIVDSGYMFTFASAISYDAAGYFCVSTSVIPRVSTLGSIGEAALRGLLVEDQGADCAVRFEYGPTIDYGDYTDWEVGKHEGDMFSASPPGVETGWHYRAEANNPDLEPPEDCGIACGADGVVEIPVPLASGGQLAGVLELLT